MALVCNGTPVKKVICNGVEVKKVFIGDEQVFVNWDGTVVGNLDMFPDEKWIKTGTSTENYNHIVDSEKVMITHIGDPCDLKSFMYIDVDVTDYSKLYYRGKHEVIQRSPITSIGYTASSSAFLYMLDDSVTPYYGNIPSYVKQVASRLSNVTSNKSETLDGHIDISDLSGIKHLCIALHSGGTTYSHTARLTFEEIYFE